MTSTRPTFVVVGGGIVGMVSALAASEFGTVTILDPSPGLGATYAAAGMLSPGAELLAGEVHALPDAIASHAQWREFAQSIGLSNSDFAPGVGSLLTGLTRGDLAEVSRLTTAATTGGVALRELEREKDGDYFSGLSPRFAKAIQFPEDSFVDVDLLMMRLRSLLEERNVIFNENEVKFIESESASIETMVGDRLTFTRGLVCTGAAMDLVSQSASQTVRSIRGVTLRLKRRGQFEPRMVRAFIDGRMIYTVERSDGSVVVGATSDESNERYVDTLAVAELLRLALLLIPSLDEAEFIEARSGLRPVGPSGQPFLETIGANWGWHSGYYRHGVLMAPLAYQRAKEYWND